MSLFYLSDLHLRSSEDRVAQLLEKFLKEKPQSGDIVVLGGDIFDLFVGYKNVFLEKFKSIIDAIKSASERGCKIYYLEGNHDFHLKKVFEAQGNIYIKTDDFLLENEALKIWVCHGDQIDRTDYGYLFLRLITRTIFVKALIFLLPNKILEWIGSWSSAKSRSYNNSERLSEARTRELKKMYQDYAYEKIQAGHDYVLIGHSHIADNKSWNLSGKEKHYLNLGFSSESLLYATIQNDRIVAQSLG